MYKNFKISEEEKQQILESHKRHGYSKPINENFGPTWLTKIKIDSPEGTTEEVKLKTVKDFQNAFNGMIAVEFGPGEWYTGDGERINNIDEYEKEVEDTKFSKPMDDETREFKKFRQANYRNTELDEPHQYKYDSFDDYLSGKKDGKPSERNAPSRYGF